MYGRLSTITNRLRRAGPVGSERFQHQGDPPFGQHHGTRNHTRVFASRIKNFPINIKDRYKLTGLVLGPRSVLIIDHALSLLSNTLSHTIFLSVTAVTINKKLCNSATVLEHPVVDGAMKLNLASGKGFAAGAMIMLGASSLSKGCSHRVKML